MNQSISFELPQRIAELFGGSGHCAGRRVAYDFQSQPAWPLWVSLLVLAALGAYAVLVYRRERRIASRRVWPLAIVRAALFALVVFMLQGWVLQPFCADPPDLVLVIDASRSMQIEDAYERLQLQRAAAALRNAAEGRTPSRIDLARSLLLADDAALLQTLQTDYKVKLYLAGEAARRLPTAPDDDWSESIASIAAVESSSRLGDALVEVLESERGLSTAAIVMLTDGAVTAGVSLDDAATRAGRLRIPLFLIGLGSEQPPRDVKLSDLAADDVVFVDDLAHFDFTLSAPGFAGREVVVKLLRNGETEPQDENKVLIGDDGQSHRVRLSHRPADPGELTYTIEAAPLQGEASRENNALTKAVRVSDETIRVLLVQEYPSWDFRALKTLLARGLRRGAREEQSKSFELSTVLQDADVEFTQLDETARRSVPLDREELFNFDVIVLGDVDRARLSQSALEAIADFVQIRGGGLVLIAGPRHMPGAFRDTPLEGLFPFRFDFAAAPGPAAEVDYRIVPTDFGLDSGLMQVADDPAASEKRWSEMPPLRWLAPINELKPAARVLAESDSKTGPDGRGQPIVAMQYAGAGKVVYIATDETYRWANYAQHDDRYYARFWMQTLRALSRSKILGKNRQAEITSDREEYQQGDVVRLKLQFFDERLAPPEAESVALVVEQIGGLPRRVQARRDRARRGEFSSSLADLAPGAYRAWLAEPTAPGDPPMHRFTVVPPPGELGRPQMAAADLRRAAEKSGGRFYTLYDARSVANDLPDGQSLRVKALPPRPVWNSPLVAGLFVGLITLEWLLRKRAGLL